MIRADVLQAVRLYSKKHDIEKNAAQSWHPAVWILTRSRPDSFGPVPKFDQGRFIAQTAFTSKEEMVKAQEAGCVSFITKPIRKNDMLGLVKKLLHR